MMTAVRNVASLNAFSTKPSVNEDAVLAFVFAWPSDPVVRILDERGKHFDRESGSNWDLFFPGYFKTSDSLASRFRAPFLSAAQPNRPVGHQFAADWAFDEDGFSELARHIALKTGGSWSYGHDAELVLFHVHYQALSPAVIDWTPFQGTLSETGSGSLQWVVNRISDDFAHDRRDPYYGVGDLVKVQETHGTSETLKTLGLGIASSVLATLGVEAVKLI